MKIEKKTYKREMAIIQLALHWALVMLTVYIAVTNPERPLDDLVALATGLAVWVYGFAATAFGMDAWAKQVKQPQPDRSLQPPDGYAS